MTYRPRTAIGYQSYTFHDHDPMIDKLRDLLKAEGKSYTWVETRSGVTSPTMRNWFSGKTRKPQFATLNAVARCLGHELTLTPIKRR